MTGLMYGAVLLVGGLLAAHQGLAEDDPNDVFTDKDLVLGGRLIAALHDEAERLTTGGTE
ncbi:hypothetical protein [Streptosporangium jomthongense]|uniref:Uncharacterized protein n=1 Tax=Streptosporangium jomthongense TaxID=1193683 RepID=A0ABV8FDZ5_9ACTN